MHHLTNYWDWRKRSFSIDIPELFGMGKERGWGSQPGISAIIRLTVVRESGTHWHHGEPSKGRLEPFKHHTTFIPRGLRRNLNWEPSYREAIASQTADAEKPSQRRDAPLRRHNFITRAARLSGRHRPQCAGKTCKNVSIIGMGVNIVNCINA